MQVVRRVLAHCRDGVAVAGLRTFFGRAQRSFEQPQLDDLLRQTQDFTVFRFQVRPGRRQQLLEPSQMFLSSLRGRQIFVARLTCKVGAVNDVLHLPPTERGAVPGKVRMVAARRRHRRVAVQRVQVIVAIAVGGDWRRLRTLRVFHVVNTVGRFWGLRRARGPLSTRWSVQVQCLKANND